MTQDRSRLIQTCHHELYSAVIADTLDGLGYRNQVAAPILKAVDERMKVAGFVRTGIYMPIFHDDDSVNVYEHEIRLIDDLSPGDVPVLVCSCNQRISPWGELLSTRAQYLRAGGCVTDGCVRDVKQIVEMDFPVYSSGRSPTDTKYRGKMMWSDVPAEIAGVTIHSGDMVVADQDGVVFVPSKLIGEVVDRALEKVRAETTIREDLRSGATLVDVFDKYGIL